MDPTQPIVMNWRSTMLGMLMLCALIALAYLNWRQSEKIAVRWLSAFIGTVVISSIPMVIGFAGAYDRWPNLTFLPTQLTLWFGPLFFLHARSLMTLEPPGRWLWLLLPGALYLAYQVWAFTALGDYKAKWAFNNTVHYPYVVPVVFYASLALTTASLLAVWRMRGQYLHWLENHRSDDDLFQPIWLTHFIVLGIPLGVVWALDYILGRAFNLNYFESFWASVAILALVFVMAVEALARLDRPFPKMAHTKEDEPLPTEHQPKTDSRDWQADGLRLRAAVLDNGWHLEANLALTDLAQRTGINQAYVSRALNQGLGSSFSAFINALRVEHAKQLILNTRTSLLDIALSSGFGSKASFNRAFKLHSGDTPSSFRQRFRPDATQ